MDRCPAEIWERIFFLACTDDGRTGRSLSLVSKYIRRTSKPYKLQSIAIDNVDHATSFILCLYKIPTQQRHVSHFTISANKNHLSVDEHTAMERSNKRNFGRIFRAMFRMIPSVAKFNKPSTRACRCLETNSQRDIAILHALANILTLISPTLQCLNIYFLSLTVPTNLISVDHITLPALTSLTLSCCFSTAPGITLNDILSSIPPLPSLEYLDLSAFSTSTTIIRSTSDLYSNISILTPSLKHIRIPMEIGYKLAEAWATREDAHPNSLPPTLQRVFVQVGSTHTGGTIDHDYLFWSMKFAGWDDRVVLLGPQYKTYHINELDALRHRQDPNQPQAIQGHDFVYCATFSLDGKYIVSGGDDHTVRVWDACTGNPTLGPLRLHNDAVKCVAFSPDGRRIASGSADNTILIWDAVTGEAFVGPLEGHADTIYSVSFSPDGKHICSGSEDMTIRIWDAQTGSCTIGPLKGHTNCIGTVVFSGDGTHIASGSWDMTVRVWDAKSGQVIHGPLRGHTERALFVAFSPDGKRIVSVSRGGNVCVWDADTGALVAGPSQRHDEGTLAVIFTPSSTFYASSPDGRWIERCIEGNSPTVEVCDSKTGLLVATFGEHTDYVRGVAFSPDSRRILSTSDDGTIRVHLLDW